MINYQFDAEVLDITETRDGSDTEFNIKLHQEQPYLDRLRLVQHVFDDNKDYTDVLFYAYAGHEYKVIVRQEHYVDFVTEMWKARLLRSLEWRED
ncbi:hypothetical protein [Paenibacillus sp. J22TS3]|uniref:hypothetical protein n=1 Tax=Paenibacillus sp. J22TS3 TaxID=2807192 RepID=UPI001B24C8B0|nr:hypothetical protein [Paenibacillus sp. J22TS3]GIP23615.1 hypothetical protein J22TS3_38900 [Paenibacillus sp. J22TS3]